MSIMPILVPFVVLATGFATIMFLLYRNLQRLDQEAGDAWRRVQEQRAVRLDASLRLLDALDAAGELADAPTAGIRQALAACREADGPEAATEADSALARAWRSFSAAADMRRVVALDCAAEAIEQLQGADRLLPTCERLYNNAATMYNNAGVTFPALLVAKRAHYALRPPYRPQHLRSASEAASGADWRPWPTSRRAS
ncbi:MAG: LemA family protein [Gordonibacter pamelaeae]